jgi:hypothetical protein
MTEILDKSPRVRFAAGALVSILLSVLILVWSASQERIHTQSSESFLAQAEVTAVSGRFPSQQRSLSPLGAVLVGKAMAIFNLSAFKAVQIVNFCFWILLALLLYLAVSQVVRIPFAGAIGPLLLLLPPVLQLVLEAGPGGIVMFFLLAPALVVMAMDGACRNWLYWTLLVILGGLAGLSVFVHHLGVWTAIGTILAWIFRDLKRARGGVLTLPPLGLEIALVLLVTMLSAVATKGLLGLDKKELLANLFGVFREFHPPFMVNGRDYREVVDGGPPMWVTIWLILVRTPIAILVGAGAGTWMLYKDGRSLRRIAPLAVSVFVLLFASMLSGTPYYAGSPSLIAPILILPAILAVIAVDSFVSRMGQVGLTGKIVCGLTLIVAVGHLLFIDARHLPFPASYANVLGGGTGAFLERGNDLFTEPTLNESAALELLETKRSVVVAPWGMETRSLVARFAKEAGVHPPVVRNGGRFPTLVFYRPQSPFSQAAFQACISGSQRAILSVDGYPLWCLMDGQGKL